MPLGISTTTGVSSWCSKLSSKLSAIVVTSGSGVSLKSASPPYWRNFRFGGGSWPVEHLGCLGSDGTSTNLIAAGEGQYFPGLGMGSCLQFWHANGPRTG